MILYIKLAIVFYCFVYFSICEGMEKASSTDEYGLGYKCQDVYHTPEEPKESKESPEAIGDTPSASGEGGELNINRSFIPQLKLVIFN